VCGGVWETGKPMSWEVREGGGGRRKEEGEEWREGKACQGEEKGQIEGWRATGGGRRSTCRPLFKPGGISPCPSVICRASRCGILTSCLPGTLDGFMPWLESAHVTGEALN
jgi:hypothetical protein